MIQQGLELIAQEEGFRPEPYRDVAGVWTIGYGHTGKLNGMPVKDHPPVTEDEAMDTLELDVLSAELDVHRLVVVPLTQQQYAALVSFVFNLGAGALARSTLLRLLNRGDYDGAAGEFRKWRKAGGQIQPGLLTRRGREEQLFRWSSIVQGG